MKKLRLIALAAAIIMLLPIIAAPAAADSSWAVFEPFEGVDEPVPAGNLLSDSSFDDEASLSRWNPNGQSMDFIDSKTGGYLRCYNIPNPTIAFDFKQDSKQVIPAGTYKFTGYFRTAYEGELTELRFHIYDKNHPKNAGGVCTYYLYPTHDEWLKVEFYITLDSDFTGIRVCGGPWTEFIQSYCLDNFSLVPSAIPSDYQAPSHFGTKIDRFQAVAANNGSAPTYGEWDPEAEKQYEVQGIMMNRDIDFIGSCSPAGTSVTEKMLKDYVYQYRNTHVTDFMINIFCQVAAYPSEVANDFLDQYYYYQKTDKNQVNSNHKMAYIMYERKDLDYIEVFCETFPEIGINPWLSYRMNDAHGVDNPDSKVGAYEFFSNHPEYRRVQHPSTVNAYYNNLFDYTHEEVREFMLKVINESLDRYDCYGIELDFQRDIWVWHIGGEYAGLDILTEFMREVNRLVSVYEEKYGHEIKIAVRCASEIQTNYDIGYDIITWAAEGLMDVVNPTARWHTNDYNVPAGLWASVMHPYGVEVAPGLECLVNLQPSKNDNQYNSFETACAAAANWLSQGADKIYMYNLFLGLSHTMPEEDRLVTAENNLSISSGAGHFNMLTTVGSYEKVVNRNRRMLVSYNDIKPNWKDYNNQIPLRVNQGSTGALRIPLGDVPLGSKVTFNFSANSLNLKNYPTVYINGQAAKYLGSAYTSNGFTTDKVLSYEVPTSAFDDGYIVAEITPQKYLSVSYADIFVEVPET